MELSVRQKEQGNQDRDHEIAERALRDDAFRRSFIDDPKGTLQREFGLTVPDGVSVVVHEETPETVHMVLPARSSADEPAPGPTMMDRKKTDCCTCGYSTHQTFQLPP